MACQENSQKLEILESILHKMDNSTIRDAQEHADKEFQTIKQDTSDLAKLIQQIMTIIEEILNCYEKFQEGVDTLLEFLRLKEGLIESLIPFDQSELELVQAEHVVCNYQIKYLLN